MNVVFERRPEGGVGVVSGAIAWFMNTLHILDEMRSDLHPLQYRLATDIICQWSRALPWALEPVGPDQPVIVTEERAPKLRDLFDGGDVTARLVRIFRTILPHHAVNQERDARILGDMTTFCTQRSDAVDAYRRHGVFNAEPWIFDAFIWHCQQLLKVVLGDAHFPEFERRYNAAMRDLQEQAELLAKPAN